MRYINPDEIERRIPQDLKDDLKAATDELLLKPEDERKAYIKRKEQLWKDTRPYLASVTGSNQSETDFKCWYCEEKSSRFTFHVDHFRPKGRVKNENEAEEPGYWWLAFDYRNYRLSCEYCNSPHSDNEEGIARGKWDQFPLAENSVRAQDPADNLELENRLLIDPTNQLEVSLLYINDEGRVCPVAPAGTFFHTLAKRTIKTLNLNQVRLVEARRQRVLDCRKLVDEANTQYVYLDRSGREGGAGVDIVAKSSLDAKLQQLRDLTAPWAQFSATALSNLRAKGEQWLILLLST